MAVKKSELYSSLWASCDELRGGMDASQYKDYVLSLLFIKYVSDKYAGKVFAEITVPEGASFNDMVALKGKPDIGDQINKKITGPLAKANKLPDFPDFNDATKLGSGKEMVDRLTNLIAIFENPALNFSKNRAGDDDLLGDAYEYLMRHFATDSGKSKGQFYTPAEVSRVIAQLLGIREAKTSADTTVYDPTCGSGSLLLKVADGAGTPVTLYGQEKDAATSGLARMNMILHNNPTATVVQGNTLTDPKFTEGNSLKTFDYVVANPPFSDKRWSTGLDPMNDPYERFNYFGTPPAKQGDYAYLLHIVRSLKSTGKGACILPHGVLFRGNAEAEIRRNLVRNGYIKGIIGLPANLFYGTGIPACIIVIDKEEAQARKGIFMIDASGGFMKDGPKNRLRARDIYKIVDTFTKQVPIPGYSRIVDFEEIEKNEFNLNLPRYLDSQQAEDVQDIEGHLNGGIPARDVEALKGYWEICPNLETALFKGDRPGYFSLAVEKSAIKSTILHHPEVANFMADINAHFDTWRKKSAEALKSLRMGFSPKDLIASLSEDLLNHFADKQLFDKYDVYQYLMDYWVEIMQDDCYLIAADGWKAETYRVIEKDKKGKERDKGWTCDLLPKTLIVARYFSKEQAAVDRLTAESESVTVRLAELEEEYGGEEGAFGGLDQVNKANVTARLKELKGDPEAEEEAAALREWAELSGEQSDLKKSLKEAEATLDAKAYAHYPRLTQDEVRALVVDDKWLAELETSVREGMDRISRVIAQRVKDLAERYEAPLPEMASRVAELELKVNRHLERMERLVKQGASQELHTQRHGSAGEWRSCQLGEVIDSCSSGATPYRGRADYYKGSVKWITSGELNFNVITDTIEHISEEAVRATHLKVHPQGTFLMAITGLEAAGTRGACGIVGSPATTNQSCMAIYPTPELRTDYLYHYYVFRGNELALRYCQGTKQQSYTAKLVKSLPIDLPPTVEEQAAIANVLSDVDAEIAALEEKLDKVRQLKQGMMQELLTGRVRLV